MSLFVLLCLLFLFLLMCLLVLFLIKYWWLVILMFPLLVDMLLLRVPLINVLLPRVFGSMLTHSPMNDIVASFIKKRAHRLKYCQLSKEWHVMRE